MMYYEKIRNYIVANGIMYNFVATKSGIEKKRFYRLINGQSRMTVEEFEAICQKGLSVDPSYFFKDKFLETKNKSA